MTRYSSSSSASYQPLSPPWSDGGSPSYTRAPAMPYVALPPVDDYMPPSPHYGLRTPPPSSSDGGISPLLCASPAIVRYDFAHPPHTVRISSSVSPATFSTTHPAAIPAQSVVHVEIEGTDHVARVRHDGAGGVRCADVFEQLHAYLILPLSSAERASVPSDVKTAFSWRRAATGDSTMRVIDLLRGRTVFKRLVLLRRGSWLLKTTSA